MGRVDGWCWGLFFFFFFFMGFFVLVAFHYVFGRYSGSCILPFALSFFFFALGRVRFRLLFLNIFELSVT